MKKRMTALLLAMSLAAVLLAGCGSTGKDSGDSKKKADDDVYHVGVIQLVEHEALDAATEGFQDALKEKHLGLVKRRRTLNRIIDRLRNIIRTFSWD